MGAILGARVLAEFGDDPHRYADGKARRNLRRHQPDHPRVRQEKVVAAGSSTTTGSSTRSTPRHSRP